jgi:hypothetical protein
MDKQCIKCGETKPEPKFQKGKNLCNNCRAARKREKYSSDPEFKQRCIDVAYAWRNKNPDKHRQASVNWYYANKEHVSLRMRDYVAANLDRHNANGARRHASKRKAIPWWADLTAVKAIYTGAKKWGWEVDHVVPLQNPLVCGLHVPANLQAIDRRLNCSKGNRYWPDMP